jgi:hypothetical protein
VWFEVGLCEDIFSITNELDKNIVNQMNYFILIAKVYIYNCRKAETNAAVYDFLIKSLHSVSIQVTLHLPTLPLNGSLTAIGCELRQVHFMYTI